jgi:diguanylate cyclase (GGDEF)-like protein
VSGSAGVEELFATVVRTVGESLDVASVDLWTFSRDSDSFECRAYWSREQPTSPDLACVGTVIALGQSGDLRRLFLTGETVEHHADDPGLPPAELAFLEDHGLQSKIDSALLVGDEIVGVLSITESRGVRRLTGDEERQFRGLRELSAAALLAAGLIARSDERNRGLRGLLASARELAVSPEVRVAVERVQAEACGLLPGIACTVDVRVRQAGGSYAPPGLGGPEAAALASPVDALVRDAMQRREPAAGRAPDGRRRLVLPFVAGAAAGYLDVCASLVRGFREDEVELLRLLADQTGAALESGRAHRALASRSAIDATSGLFTTWYLYERLYSEVARARRYGQPLSLVPVEIDAFQEWSAVHGDEAGAAALKAVTRMLKGCLRDKVDVACRDGDAGFTFLLPNTAGLASGAGIVAERMRQMVERTLVVDDDLGALGKFTLSVGVAAFPQHADDVDELVAAARESLQAARAAGGDAVRISTHER